MFSEDPDDQRDVHVDYEDDDEIHPYGPADEPNEIEPAVDELPDWEQGEDDDD